MKYEIIQTAPYPTAEFTFQRKSGDIGTAKWTCDKKHGKSKSGLMVYQYR
nr:hypothetical protein [uncultured Oscillibacter sp.]